MYVCTCEMKSVGPCTYTSKNLQISCRQWKSETFLILASLDMLTAKTETKKENNSNLGNKVLPSAVREFGGLLLDQNIVT